MPPTFFLVGRLEGWDWQGNMPERESYPRVCVGRGKWVGEGVGWES